MQLCLPGFCREPYDPLQEREPGMKTKANALYEEVAGKIGLQSEGAPIEIRNIRLTPIKK